MTKIMLLFCMFMFPLTSLTGCTNTIKNEVESDDEVIEEIADPSLEEEPDEETEILPLYGDNYFGLSVPQDTAEVFAPDFISLPDRLVGKVVVEPGGKGMYYQMYNQTFQSTIYYTEVVDGVWTTPRETSFAIDENILLSSISPDGNWIYIHQNSRESNIYRVAVTETGWGNLELLELPINSDSGDAGYQVQEDGTGYLNSSREGSEGKDIWEIKQLDDGSFEAINIGEVVNSENWDFSPCIAPDGSYMIFGSDRLGRSGLARLYITFKTENGDWTAPVNLNMTGVYVNDDSANQSNPSVSPDGEHLFFMRHYETYNMGVYWITTSFINDIKDIVLGDE